MHACLYVTYWVRVDLYNLVRVQSVLYLGYGVFTKKSFGAGDFLLIHHGEVIEKNKAELRKKQYMKDK